METLYSNTAKNLIKVEFPYSELLEKYLYAHNISYWHYESENVLRVHFNSILDLNIYTQNFLDTKEERGYVCAWKQFEDTEENIHLSKSLNIEDFKNWVNKHNEEAQRERERERYEHNNS